MPARPDLLLLSLYKKWANWFAWAVFCIGLLVLAGWWLEIGILKRPHSSFSATHPISAICFVCCCLSFFLLNGKFTTPYKKSIGYTLAVLVMIMALLIIADYISGLEWKIDHWGFAEMIRQDAIRNLPARIAMNTAICFFLSGSGLLLFYYKTPNGHVPSQYIALVVFFLSFFSILGYVYGVPEFYNRLNALPMALQTAIGFLFFSLALLLVNPAAGVTGIFAGRLEGSLRARILIPAVFILPVIIGGLRLIIHYKHPLSVELEVTMLIIAIILVFTALMWVTIKLINRRDLQQKKAEEKFRGLLEAAPDAIIISGEKSIIQLVNAQTEKMFGYKREELIGQKIEMLMPARYRDAHNARIPHYFKNPRNRKMGEEQELCGRRKDGTEFYIEISVSPLQTEEGLLVTAVIRDVTIRKTLEARLKQFNAELEQEVKLKTSELTDMLERISDAFVGLDKDFHYTYLNKKMLALTGKHVDDLIGKPVWELIPGAAEFPVYKFARKAMEEQSYVTHTYYDNQYRRWNESHIYPSPHGLSVFIRDITERKKAEARIREAEQRYQSTLDSMIEGCQIIDFNWRYVYINPVAAHQGHSEPSTLLGRTMMECYPGIEHTPLFVLLKRCMENRSTEQIENEFVYGDGSSNWFELRIQPSPEGLFILSIDISGRKKSEEKILALNSEIAKSERRFRGMIENGNDLVILTDEQFNPLYRSPNFERVTGWTQDELDKKGPQHLMDSNDLSLLLRMLPVIIRNPGKSYPVSFRFMHKNGRQLWMEGITTNLLHEESIKAVVSNLRDVSQRKQDEIKLANSERIYKTIASNIPGAVIILFDKQHRYLQIEGDLLLRLGYFKENLLGKIAGEVLPAEVYNRFKSGLDRVFSGEAFTVESSNTGIDTLTRFVPIRDEQNEVSLSMLVVIDVTELKSAEKALADLNRDLEQKVTERTEQLAMVNRELEAFTYSVSHDLRAPLRIIDGFADILVSDYTNTLDEEGNRTLGVIKSNAQRMGQLIDDLLNLSRLGRKELQITNVNMDHLVHAVIEEQQMLSKFKIPVACEPLLPARCDSSLLRQVWGNLISNAVKYSSKKIHPEISIGSYSENSHTVYYIKDNGVGFDMQYAGKLFGVFQRLHKQTEFEGTGVGLALVQRIVNKHGGKIWAEAEPGKGAQFSFTLPGKSN